MKDVWYWFILGLVIGGVGAATVIGVIALYTLAVAFHVKSFVADKFTAAGDLAFKLANYSVDCMGL